MEVTSTFTTFSFSLKLPRIMDDLIESFPYIEKVISGGQTGADRAALEAAAKLGVPTGGWAPPGFLTSRGKDFALRDQFHLKEIVLKGNFVAVILSHSQEENLVLPLLLHTCSVQWRTSMTRMALSHFVFTPALGRTKPLPMLGQVDGVGSHPLQFRIDLVSSSPR